MSPHSLSLPSREKYIEDKLKEKRLKERQAQMGKQETQQQNQEAEKAPQEHYEESTDGKSKVVGNWLAGLVEYELPLEFAFSSLRLFISFSYSLVIRRKIFRRLKLPPENS